MAWNSWGSSTLGHRSTTVWVKTVSHGITDPGKRIALYDLHSSGNAKAVEKSDLFLIVLTTVWPPLHISSTCRKLVCKHVLSWPPRYLIHIVFLVCSINGRNTADNNDFQEFPPFFAKPAASSENIWHKRTDMTVFHIGNISEMPKMRRWIPEHLTAELGFPQVLKIHL